MYCSKSRSPSSRGRNSDTPCPTAGNAQITFKLVNILIEQFNGNRDNEKRKKDLFLFAIQITLYLIIRPIVYFLDSSDFSKLFNIIIIIIIIWIIKEKKMVVNQRVEKKILLRINFFICTISEQSFVQYKISINFFIELNTKLKLY